MRIAIEHVTRLDYDGEATDAIAEVRLGPRNDEDQQVTDHTLTVTPQASISQYVDGFGNNVHVVAISRPHRFSEYHARSETRTFLADPFAVPPTAPTPLTAAEEVDYLQPSPFVPSLPEFVHLGERFHPQSEADTFEAARRLSEFVYNEFRYVKDATTIDTPVATVLHDRRGVCQDFAHVLLGLCRASGIPARYVSGYIASRASDERRGAEASHAWVEAWTPTHGWRGFDAANNLVVNDLYVKMAIGRDYGDAAPNRGSFRGIARESLSVSVSTKILEA